MAVNSAGFLILFLVILILYYRLPKSWKMYFLALVSIGLYLVWGVEGTLCLVALAFFTWFTARFANRTVLWINIVFIAGILLAIRLLPAGSIIVPIGISFYSLQALGYVADVYKRKIKPEENFFRYLLFLSFFPTVTSGPIQRTDVLLKELHEDKEFSYEGVRHGLLMIAYGLFAKNFVADRLELIVDNAYKGYDSLPGLVLVMGVIAYAFELYCDFMGYSVVALGAAEALGFKLPDNFKRPYFATSVKEFWNRWHISLSVWLRDYIYFPLGGSRKGKVRTLFNIAAVFFISGIWHGRGLTFIIWGLLHGLYRIFDELTLKKRNEFKVSVKSSAGRVLFDVVSGALTFIAVDFAWLFFRAESVDKALVMVRRIFTEFDIMRTLEENLYAFGLARKEMMVWFLGLVVVLIVDILHEKGISVSDRLAKMAVLPRWILYTAFVLFIICAEIYYYGYSASTFIYSGF